MFLHSVLFCVLEKVKSRELLRLGTRVVRGPDWKWKNQDTDGPGTVIQHSKNDSEDQHNVLHLIFDVVLFNFSCLLSVESDPLWWFCFTILALVVLLAEKIV